MSKPRRGISFWAIAPVLCVIVMGVLVAFEHITIQMAIVLIALSWLGLFFGKLFDRQWDPDKWGWQQSWTKEQKAG